MPKSRSRSRSMRGGGGAASWVESNFGTGDQQWSNTFAGRTGVGSLSNLLPTVPGAPAVLAGNIPQGTLSLKNIPFMSGGRRGGRANGGRANGGRRHRSRKQKGGFWGQMLAQAAVPLTLLGLQQTFKRKRRR